MARRLIRGQLADWGLDEHSEVAELLVSELVTNAVHYASGPVGLTLHSFDGTLRCAVEDADTAQPHMRRAREDEEGGRGLYLVELLSCRWGSEGTTTGKIVWFELCAHALPKS
jgi:anti-sigma regulatory factor (Ser/Thr protein kinase)